MNDTKKESRAIGDRGFGHTAKSVIKRPHVLPDDLKAHGGALGDVKSKRDGTLFPAANQTSRSKQRVSKQMLQPAIRNWAPTPKQIAAAAAKIRAGWSEEVRMSRFLANYDVQAEASEVLPGGRL